MDRTVAPPPRAGQGAAGGADAMDHPGFPLSLDEVCRRLAAGRAPEPGICPHTTRAAVALVLRPGPDGPEMLFIERARKEGDPWSGHLAFPGGRLEPSDPDARAAAERETLEEVGLDLRGSRFAGEVGTVCGDRLPVTVRCFAYAVGGGEPLRPNHEVAHAFWVPLGVFLDPSRHLTLRPRFSGADEPEPAVRLAEPHRPVLWGITYRLVRQFFSRLGLGFPPDARP